MVRKSLYRYISQLNSSNKPLLIISLISNEQHYIQTVIAKRQLMYHKKTVNTSQKDSQYVKERQSNYLFITSEMLGKCVLDNFFAETNNIFLFWPAIQKRNRRQSSFKDSPQTSPQNINCH